MWLRFRTIGPLRTTRIQELNKGGAGERAERALPRVKVQGTQEGVCAGFAAKWIGDMCEWSISLDEGPKPARMVCTGARNNAGASRVRLGLLVNW